MKICPYCGMEYADDAIECPLDQTRLLLAPTATEPATESSPNPVKRSPATGGYSFYAMAFAILSGFFGVGLAWLVVGIPVIIMSRNHEDALSASSTSLLLAGGIIGFIAGLYGFLHVVKPDNESETLEKNFGEAGPGGSARQKQQRNMSAIEGASGSSPVGPCFCSSHCLLLLTGWSIWSAPE